MVIQFFLVCFWIDVADKKSPLFQRAKTISLQEVVGGKLKLNSYFLRIYVSRIQMTFELPNCLLIILPDQNAADAGRCFTPQP